MARSSGLVAPPGRIHGDAKHFTYMIVVAILQHGLTKQITVDI